MSPTKNPATPTRPGPASSAGASPALEWLWRYLRDVPNPHILDCGPVSQVTLDVFLRRGAKVYVADLLTLLQSSDEAFWDRSGKISVFLQEKFLAQLPPIAPESLSVVFCWHLLDLLPRAALAGVVGRLGSYLRPGGAFLCLLREASLAEGTETTWSFETLTVLSQGPERRGRFTYPPLTNREVEKLMPGGNVKTFLTRAGRREVLALK